ncbi:MEKHLA domain-containing protein [Rhizobium lentis]|uniref:MEKHLA domain-containing protein n=1 Tax=Rhizobium lentis TaxID=1138194 RepID=UPI0035C920F5
MALWGRSLCERMPLHRGCSDTGGASSRRLYRSHQQDQERGWNSKCCLMPCHAAAASKSRPEGARSGKRFWKEHGVIWQLGNSDGRMMGQAAKFSKWSDA